jgi:hypothetical protein
MARHFARSLARGRVSGGGRRGAADGPGLRLRRAACFLGCAAASVVVAPPAPASTHPPAPARTPSWTVYHDGPAGRGVAAGVGSVDTAARAWTSPALDGQLYGEPLVFGDRVFVATENDTVYALSAATGAIIWSARLGTPVPSTLLPCSNINPTVAITGTPVIDPARHVIFVVADELAGAWSRRSSWHAWSPSAHSAGSSGSSAGSAGHRTRREPGRCGLGVSCAAIERVRRSGRGLDAIVDDHGQPVSLRGRH